LHISLVLKLQSPIELICIWHQTKTPHADHTIWTGAQQNLDFFNNQMVLVFWKSESQTTSCSSFFRSFQNLLSVFSKTLKEPPVMQKVIWSVLRFFENLCVHVNKNIIDIWVVLVDVCGDVWLGMWILCIFYIGEGLAVIWDLCPRLIGQGNRLKIMEGPVLRSFHM